MWGLLHRVGRYGSGGSPFSSTVCWSCRCMEGFLKIRGWDPILPGWCWLHEAQLISHQLAGLGFPHRAGRCRSGGLRFVPGLLELWRYGRICDPGMITYLPRVRRDHDVSPRNNSRSVLAPWAPANQQSASGVGISTPCGVVSTRGISVFGPGLLKL